MMAIIEMVLLGVFFAVLAFALTLATVYNWKN